MSSAHPLSRNNQLVLDCLSESHGPLSAYQLLDRLRPEGLRAPPQVYRALKSLADHGLVHKLESTNTYVVCAHARCCGGEACAGHQTVFLICDGCGSAQEVDNAKLADELNGLSKAQGFAVERTSIEVRGRCGHCAEPAA